MSSKQKIIETAVKLFLKQGFYNTSLSNIASECGLTKAGVYHYFGSKDELIYSVFNFLKERLYKHFVENFEDSDSIKDILYKEFKGTEILKNPSKLFFCEDSGKTNQSYSSMMSDICRSDGKYKTVASFIIEKARSFNTELIKRGQKEGGIRCDISPETAAEMIHSIIEGMVYLSDIDKKISPSNDSEAMFKFIWTILKEDSLSDT